MTSKMSKKRIIILSIVAVVILGLLAGVLYYIFKPDKGNRVETLEVAKGSVVQTLDKTATVQASDSEDFVLVDGVTVKTVNVLVGQTVKKGQVLATFDTSSLQQVVNEKKDAYNTAKAAYDKYISSSSSALGQLSAIDSQIASLELKIAKLEQIIKTQKEEAKIPENTTPEEKNEIEKLKEALNNLIDDAVLSSKLIQHIIKNSDSAKQVIDALKGLINSMGKGTIDASDIQSMLGSTMTAVSKEQTQLLEAQLELAGLKAKRATLALSADSTLQSIYKKVVDTTYSAYQKAQSMADAVGSGWIAKQDGIVSKVNIKAGQKFESDGSSANSGTDISALLGAVTSGEIDLSSMLGDISTKSASALTVQYFPLKATFTLAKNEVSKVKVGQKVDIVLNSDETVSGTVIYKSAVASEGSSLDIGGLIGGSSTSGGLEVQVQLDEYSDSIVIGFDVEISIKTDETTDTIVVPIESILYEDSKAYVYKFNAEESKIYKSEVTIGLRDDMSYEILSGCSVGDIIVKSPSSTMKDGLTIQSNVIGKTVK